MFHAFIGKKTTKKTPKPRDFFEGRGAFQPKARRSRDGGGRAGQKWPKKTMLFVTFPNHFFQGRC